MWYFTRIYMQNKLPKFYETFIPILNILSNNKTISMNDLRKNVRDTFYNDIDPSLLEIKTKGGQQMLLNRIGWGKAYLKQAKMVFSPSRGLVQITEKGQEALKKGALSLGDLKRDPDYSSYQKISRQEKEIQEIGDDSSPQDLIDSGFQSIEQQLRIDLLEQLRNINPYYFQKVVLILLEKMGYGDFVETPKSGDGGIDGIIKEDKLGLDKIYVQAKRYADNNKVRETDIRNFIGAMSRDANKGIFVTTSDFDDKAIQKARDAQQKIVLIDGYDFVDLMLKYGVGLQVKNTYEVKEIDEDFFEEE